MGSDVIGVLIYVVAVMWMLYRSFAKAARNTEGYSEAKQKLSDPKAKHSNYEYAQAFPEAFQQGDVQRAVMPPSDMIAQANQAMTEASARHEALWPSSLRIYGIGLMAESIRERNDRLLVGILPYIVVKYHSNYERIRFTLFDHLAHTRAQWDHTYKLNASVNLAMPPYAIPLPINEIDDRWTLDMRVDGILFAVYHVNPADIIDGITDVGEITTRVGADGEIDIWSRLAAAKSDKDISLDELLDTPTASIPATHAHKSRNT